MKFRWYVVHVYSGFEKRVVEGIREQSVARGMESLIEEVLIPTEEVVEIRRGKRVMSERKFFPGYLLIKMAMNDQTWHLVTTTPKVTGFLGSTKKPMPISDAEAQRILSQVQEGVESPKPSITFVPGEQVRVCDGPFTSFNGHIEDVDVDRSRIKVLVSIFGRETPVDLEYAQVEKI